MNNINRIRELVKQGRSSDIRRLLLTDSALEMVKYVEMRGIITSNQVANNFSLSIQNACMRLTKLAQQGYLNRKEEGDPSGGIRYVYTINSTGEN